MPAKSRVGAHAERGPELRREVRGPRRHDAVDRRIVAASFTRAATSSPATSRSAATMSPTATEMPGTLIERV